MNPVHEQGNGATAVSEGDVGVQVQPHPFNEVASGQYGSRKWRTAPTLCQGSCRLG